ncbi:MAG: hypothetical protein HYY76_15610 [Acidobacteria bacterium]|nr:hypothetical protein [Acidobacteriota bacterium]
MTRASGWTAMAAFLVVATAITTGQERVDRTGRAPRREPLEPRVRPAALAELIEQLGGRYVTMPHARVIGVVNPRVFLVESASLLPAARGNLDRVLVMIDRGQLSAAPSLLVDATVKVGGVARTLVGLQVTREVPWPPELTPELVKRLEIRAAVLASSVETADGVDLVQDLPASSE